jgi:hypothetical protein
MSAALCRHRGSLALSRIQTNPEVVHCVVGRKELSVVHGAITGRLHSPNIDAPRPT